MDRKRVIVPIIFLIACVYIISMFSYLFEEYDKNPTLNILMFHVVCDEMPEDKSLSDLYITRDRLEEYCRYFKERYDIVSLNEAYEIIKNKKGLDNTNLLAFTFDDGYEDNYTLGFPILNKYGVKFNINVIARYTDEKYDNYLSWEQIKEMNKSGLLELGNHTYDSHVYVDDYSGESMPILKALLPNESEEKRQERILSDLEKADKLISESVNNKINIMAYPYGVPPKDMQGEIRSKFNYNIELMVKEGVNRKTSDFSKLNRFIADGFEKPQNLEKRMKFYKGLDFLGKRSKTVRELFNFNF